MQVGEPRYDNERKSKNYFNLEKGDNVFRILPPLGNLAQAGHWSKYWSIHWGYKDTKGKNRPFQSPEIKNHNTRMIEVSDAAKVKVDLMSAKRDQLSKELKAAVDSRDVASTKRDCTGWRTNNKCSTLINVTVCGKEVIVDTKLICAICTVFVSIR